MQGYGLINASKFGLIDALRASGQRLSHSAVAQALAAAGEAGE